MSKSSKCARAPQQEAGGAGLTKQAAKRQVQFALDVIDLAHCFSTGQANEISFQGWQNQFARHKEFEAARKQWFRWKKSLGRYGLCEHVADGRETHVVLKPTAVEVAEQLRAEAQAVLDAENPVRRFPDSVTIAGQKYRLKVHGRSVRPLTDVEFKELRTSIQLNGLRVRVLVDRDYNVVDGKHRLIIAEDLGLVVPVLVLDETDRNVLDVLAVQLNACRRHLTKQERAELRRQRQARVAVLRAEGKSLRQIAEAEGVTPTTVRKDLRAVGAPTPEVVVGKDGRRHPGQRRADPASVAVEAGTVEPDQVEAWDDSVRVEGVEFRADPDADTLDDCLETALAALTDLRERVAVPEAELVDTVSDLVRAVRWRLRDLGVE